jgi:hypothetical protein
VDVKFCVVLRKEHSVNAGKQSTKEEVWTYERRNDKRLKKSCNENADSLIQKIVCDIELGEGNKWDFRVMGVGVWVRVGGG